MNDLEMVRVDPVRRNVAGLGSGERIVEADCGQVMPDREPRAAGGVERNLGRCAHRLGDQFGEDR